MLTNEIQRGRYWRTALAPFAAAAASGSFWGTWGAAIPRLRDQAGIDDLQLGTALLFLGAGALPTMLVAGSVMDRWGARRASISFALLGLSGVAVAMFARDFVALCVGFAVVGAASGAADVVINSVSARAEQDVAKPIITRAHGVISSFVVVSSLLTGALTGTGISVAVPFLLVQVVTIVAAVVIASRAGVLEPVSDDLRPDAAPTGSARRFIWVVGILGALAFATENAQQSWSAVFFEDVLASGVGFSALAPAIFAAVVATTRFAFGAIPVEFARRTMIIGAMAAAAGSGVLAVAASIPVAAVGLAFAAAGTAVLFPTLVGVVSRWVPHERRGRAISLMTTIAYLGFVLGPAYVGLLAEVGGLRWAMLGVAALGLMLATLATVRPRVFAVAPASWARPRS